MLKYNLMVDIQLEHWSCPTPWSHNPALLSLPPTLVVHMGAAEPQRYPAARPLWQKPSSVFTRFILNCLHRPTFFSPYPWTPGLPWVWSWNAFCFLWPPHIQQTLYSKQLLHSCALVQPWLRVFLQADYLWFLGTSGLSVGPSSFA